MDRNVRPINAEGQAQATQAIFNEFWKGGLFAGYVWKWSTWHDAQKPAGQSNGAVVFQMLSCKVDIGDPKLGY